MKRSILLIDDDHGPMDYYVEALRSRGFDVKQIDKTDEAFRWVEDPATLKPAMVVLDLMLPPGSRLSLEQTDGGLRSGVFIAEAIRKRFPDMKIVALTNYNHPDVIRSLPEGIEAKAKFETAPFPFADFVERMLSGSSPQT